MYCNFLSSVFMSESKVLPVLPSVLALFIAHLSDSKCAPADIDKLEICYKTVLYRIFRTRLAIGLNDTDEIR